MEILNKIENDSKSGSIYKTKAKEYVYKVFNEINTKDPLDSKIHKLLWELSPKIITTNYDQILETNKPLDPSIDVFGNENSYLALKSQREDSKFLYKIHGDFKNPTTIILFESDYKTIYSTSNANEDALGDFFKNKTFLFLGFSLSDPFVNDLFTKIKSLYNNYTVGNHYIFSTNDHNDFSNFDVKLIKIDDWGESLVNYLNALIQEKVQEEDAVIDEKDPNILDTKDDNIEDLAILIKIKIDDLKKDPGNRELASEMHNIKSKIDQLMYGDLDYLKTFDKKYKNNHLQMLFDTIYANETLTKETFDEINRIRNDYENHQWFERCQLISAITCSLFISNKADEKKISILVDFINDNEDKVWERALTYLVMILNHLGNKWLRFDTIKRKVKSLTLNLKVQEACQQIVEYILVIGIGKYNFTEKIFENLYFRETPYNYFLPFFKEHNPLFDNIYDNYDGENIERFIEALERSPLPDSFKYIMCNTKGNEKEGKKNDFNAEKDIERYYNINGIYYPYAGYIQEFVSFIRGFPALQHKKLIDTQLKLTSTPLKDYLLSEKEKFRVLGIHFHKEKNWGQAIINFEKYLQLSPEDLAISDNLVNCHLSNKEIGKAKDLSALIRQKYPKYTRNLNRLASIYFSQKSYQKALDIYDESINSTDKNANSHYEKSVVFIEMNKYEDALKSIQNAERQNFEPKSRLYNVYGVIYQHLKFTDEAMESFTKAIALDQSNPIYYSNRSNLYEEINNYDKALEDINEAISLTDDETLIFTKVYYLIYLNQFELAFSQLTKVRVKNANYYNTLANCYRLKGEYDLAFSTIEKAISLENNHTAIGTKAAIYASIGDDVSFYKHLDEILKEGVLASKFLPDIKEKYKHKKEFKDILQKYNQVI
ncbi:Tetratricopeptide repeat-containing protein [Chryseobacterium oleae]|uniref:Tetratricopeptide repeat-containing protein n=1 Tax=Chryseobacterium oleae TaxID=491207 RepID=A0A1I5A1T4_CHROL|nr:SIR2 family protein [Chryseobacterium oleae]SFN56330.1 Tetratricopeptide repeat-containing protein [Chryseobacterium oleae]